MSANMEIILTYITVEATENGEQRKVMAVLEDVYRFFNRVSDEDGERLEALEYRMPSLSAGDLIAIRPVEREYADIYRVENMGFAHILPGLGGTTQLSGEETFHA